MGVWGLKVHSNVAVFLFLLFFYFLIEQLRPCLFEVHCKNRIIVIAVGGPEYIGAKR